MEESSEKRIIELLELMLETQKIGNQRQLESLEMQKSQVEKVESLQN